MQWSPNESRDACLGTAPRSGTRGARGNARAIDPRKRYIAGLMKAAIVVDARGLRCPVNWAKAKTVLEEVAHGTLVEVLVDDPRSERDLPAAAEAEGHAVLEVEAVATHLRILIEK